MYDKVLRLFDTTTMTYAQIAERLGCSISYVSTTVRDFRSPAEIADRKRQSYAASKTGDKNPMTGRTREAHPRYVGEVSDGKGYIMVLKPDWYTGRKGSRHVFKHHVVMCEALGLTSIPAGFSVHHIDHNPTNNNLTNLALLSNGAHSRLHQLERATTIPQGSRG